MANARDAKTLQHEVELRVLFTQPSRPPKLVSPGQPSSSSMRGCQDCDLGDIAWDSEGIIRVKISKDGEGDIGWVCSWDLGVNYCALSDDDYLGDCDDTSDSDEVLIEELKTEEYLQALREAHKDANPPTGPSLYTKILGKHSAAEWKAAESH